MRLKRPLDDVLKEDEEEKMTLNEFMQNYKSEDNESFNKIMYRDMDKYQEKYWWMYSQKQDYDKKQLMLE